MPNVAAQLGIPIIGGIINKVLDKVAKDKVDDATMAEIKNAAAQALRDDAQEDIKEFYDFMLEYEGRAEDHGPFIKNLRGSIRPIITYINFGFIVYIALAWLMGWVVVENAQAETVTKIFFALNGLTLGFWFGERALKNIGLADFFKMKGSK